MSICRAACRDVLLHSRLHTRADNLKAGSLQCHARSFSGTHWCKDGFKLGHIRAHSELRGSERSLRSGSLREEGCLRNTSEVKHGCQLVRGLSGMAGGLLSNLKFSILPTALHLISSFILPLKHTEVMKLALVFLARAETFRRSTSNSSSTSPAGSSCWPPVVTLLGGRGHVMMVPQHQTSNYVWTPVHSLANPDL